MQTKDNLRVLIIFSQPWKIGGAETHLFTLVQELRNLAIYTVIVGIDDAIKDVFKGFPVYILPLRIFQPSRCIDNICNLKAIINQERINIIHCHQRTATVYAAIFKLKYSIPYTLTVHDRWRPFHRLYRPFLPQFCIAISEGVKTHCFQKLGIKAERINVIPNGICLDFSDSKVRPSNSSIIYVSRLNRIKAQVAIKLCQAVEILRQSIPSVTLTIVGDGPYFKDVVEQANVINDSVNSQIVILLGARSDVPELLASHSLTVGVGRVALEAMAAQSPVMAIADLENFPGLITAANWQKASTTSWTRGDKEVSVLNIVKELETVLLNPILKKELGVFGQELVRTQFSARTMALRTIKHYEYVLDKV